MDSTETAFVASHFRPGNPDFLSLPWHLPLTEWAGNCEQLENLPIGSSRHPVVFVSYGGSLFALKELPVGIAQHEYEMLKRMGDLRLPVVQAAGFVKTHTIQGQAEVLVTRYLEHSIPYYRLFQRGSLARYREHLLDAMVSLLVQLHLAGVFWGDCSMYNTLFRRDAGALQAYLVDAETSEIHPGISDGSRRLDVDIMEENVCGALVDLRAAGLAETESDVRKVGSYLRQRYEELWTEITREEILRATEPYRVQERVRALNALGFSVDEVELRATEGGRKILLRAVVTDRTFHRNVLQTLTGLDAEEMQARLIVNEIQEVKASLSQARNRSVPLSVAAYHWQNEVYLPVMGRIQVALGEDNYEVEAYCEVLEHKWYLSERAQCDVGHEKAVEDYLAQKHVGIKDGRGASDGFDP